MHFDYDAALALLRTNAWLPLAILVVGYLVRLTASDSKFPINLPKQWHSALIVGLTWLYALLRAWPDWTKGLDLPLLLAFGVLVVKALFYGREPVWLRWLAFADTEEEKPKIETSPKPATTTIESPVENKEKI